jgi:hypothetical protein
MISSDEALLLLKKWHEDKHPLKLLIAGDGFRMSFAGMIEDMDNSRLAFLPSEPNECEGESLLELSGCKFEYGDSREALPDSSSRFKFSSILSIIRRDGTAFLFAERAS